MSKYDYLAMFLLAAICVVLSICVLLDYWAIKRLKKRMAALEKKDRQFLAVKSTLVL
jgi:hypothetical protein